MMPARLRIATLVTLALATALLAAPPASAEENLAVVQVLDLQCVVPPDQRPEEGGENLRHELVVLVNTIDEPVDMSGWTMSNAIRPDREEADEYGFPDGFTLQPGAEVTIHTGVGDDNATDLFWDRATEAFKNDLLDGVSVRDAEGGFVHSNECGSFAFGCPDVTATALESGAIELDIAFGDSLDPDRWAVYRADTTEGDTFVRVATLDGAVDAFVDGTVPKGETVRYIVVAEFAHSRGADCREVSVTSIPYFPSAILGVLALGASVGAYGLLRRR